MQNKNEELFYDVNNKNPITRTQLIAMILGPDFKLAWIYVHKYIQKLKFTKYHESLMDFTLETDPRTKKGYKNTLLISGRGLGKSVCCTTGYTLTHLLRNQNLRICVVSAKSTQAEGFVTEIKQFFEGPIMKIFGDFRDMSCWRRTEITLQRSILVKDPTLVCGSMTSSASIIGKHFDIIILDDTVSMENSCSQLMREKFKFFIDSTVKPTLINSEKYGLFHIIGTHYHPADYYSNLIDKEAERKEKGLKPLYNILLKPSLIEREDGTLESVAPAIKTTEFLLNAREEMDSISFDMQFMAKVHKSNSQYFKKEYIQYFEDYIYDKEQKQVYVKQKSFSEDNEEATKWIPVNVYMGTDLAIAQNARADRFCITIVGVSKSKDLYLLDIYTGKLTFAQQQKKIMEYANKWPVRLIGVDSTAYQIVMTQTLLENTNLPIKKMQLTKNKEFRISNFSSRWENYKVYLRQDNHDLQYSKDLALLIEETLNFPANHDDTIDSFCLAWETSNTFEKYHKPEGIDVERFLNAF